MDPAHIILLLAAGLLGGFIAGLVGVGGGIIFAPVLFFYFQAIGIDPALVTPLTLGSSLFCTCVTSIISTWQHHLRGAVWPRVAIPVGLVSALALFLTTRLVTTQPWYDREAFQVVFSMLLLFVAVRMIRDVMKTQASPSEGDREAPETAPASIPWPVLGGIGIGAGSVAASAGVGGGVILVPGYNKLMNVPFKIAVGTSSATIIIIALSGIFSYMFAGLDQPVPGSAVGYVDFGRALLLAIPAAFGARIGARTAHRVSRRILRISFATFAIIVALRLLYRALG